MQYKNYQGELRPCSRHLLPIRYFVLISAPFCYLNPSSFARWVSVRGRGTLLFTWGIDYCVLISSDWALGLTELVLAMLLLCSRYVFAMLSLCSRYALAPLLPSYRDTDLSSPTEHALVLYDSVLSTVTHVIGPSLVSLYAIVTVCIIPREEYGIHEPLLSFVDFGVFPFPYSYHPNHSFLFRLRCIVSRICSRSSPQCVLALPPLCCVARWYHRGRRYRHVLGYLTHSRYTLWFRSRFSIDDRVIFYRQNTVQGL